MRSRLVWVRLMVGRRFLALWMRSAMVVSFDDFSSDVDVTRCRDINGEAEAVEELGAEFAFFGVHSSDKHEVCWCGM